VAYASSITIIGLGPGDAALLTVEARDALASAPEVWLRTARHPTVAGLPSGPAYHSFDDIYEREPSFDAVYRALVERVLDLARRPHGVVYAVPGHPLFGEATVRAILTRAHDAGIDVRVIAGVSFIDTIAVALGIDPLSDGLLILDALSLADHRRALVPERPTIIAQVYDRRAASQAKLALLESYPPEHAVRIVRASGTPERAVIDTTVAALDREDAFDHLVSLYVPPLGLLDDTRSFEGLRAVIAQLRNPDGGCPWDLEQTHDTLKRFLLEEAYEALDALDEGEPHRMAEEMGDLLMQIVLHAQVAEDQGDFVIEDVIGAIAAKLIRRHPHVFGDVAVSGADDVLRNWETLKQAERGEQPLLDAVPKAMPALAQAQSLLARAAKAGDARAPLATTQLLDGVATLADAATPDALGEVLLAIVDLARTQDLDAEESLRLALRRFREEFGEREARSRALDSA
jgi:tetrapyrrole methylase family protein/MazG family protein